MGNMGTFLEFWFGIQKFCLFLDVETKKINFTKLNNSNNPIVPY